MAVLLTNERIVASEKEAQWQSRTATSSAVMWVRGFLGSAATEVGERIPHLLAHAGFAVVAHDFGGGSTWNNATYKARANTVLTWMEARWSRIYAAGESMGGGEVLTIMREYPARIRAAALFAPVTKLDAIHDRDGGIGGAIETAHGGASAYEAALPTIDPYRNTAAHTRDSLQLWYSTDDTTVIPSDVLDFAAASQSIAISQGAVGHSSVGVDVNSVVDFFRSR